MVTKQTSAANEFLTGGGEMGELIRAYDWQSSSLGDPANWPQSLKTCVRIILTSSQPMFVWWGKQLINIYNDAYKTIVRGKHPEALGQPASVVWKEIWHEVKPRVNIVLNDNIGTYDEALLLIMERNGYPEETYYTFSYSPIAGESGGVEGIICANTDTTERIIGERQLRTLRDLGKNIQGTQTANDVYEKMIEVITHNPHDFPFSFIYKLDESGTLAQLVEKTSNITNEKIAPQVITINDKAPWSISEVVKTSATIITNEISPYGPLPTGPWELPPSKALVIPITKTGRPTPLAILVVGLNPYRLIDEKYKSFFQLLADQAASAISTAQTLEEERNRAEALTELDKAKTRFFSNISHEFRTPLTLMLGPLEDLLQQQDNELSDHNKRIVGTTHRNAMRLLRLVNALLDFSRIESGRIHANYQRTDITSFTNDLASNFRSVMEKAGLQFEVHCDDIKTPVYIDKEMWEKIVLNLLSNAFKYTLTGKITVTLKQVNDQINLQIADTGVGIPERELPMMFERFHRVQNSAGRSHEGTGIGLSLVSELVKFHHGTISVTSKEGKGSTFSVTIPIGKTHLSPSHVSEKETDLSGTFSNSYIQEALNLAEDISPENKIDKSVFSSNGHTQLSSVLIVDDNSDMRNYLSTLLGKQFNIEIASNGKEALDKIKKHSPDIVVSDIMMPVMDGVTMVKHIKENAGTSDIPVILLSARAGEQEKIEGYETGADDYLVKPFSAKELLARIQAQLKIAALRKKQNEAISNSEQRLRDMIMQAPVSMAILRGPNYIFEIANDDYFVIAGKKPEQIMNKPLLEALPEISTQGIKEIMDTVVATGKPYIGNEFPLMINRFGKEELTYFNFI
ncbi:MAG: response regulator, partial [Chitinophagaceae bacterium]